MYKNLKKIIYPIKCNMINQKFFKCQLSDEEYQAIEHEKLHYEHPRAAIIEALKIVQKKRGWISDNSIHSIAQILGISSSEVDGVATFYSNIYRKPVGRHIIRYCDSIVCYITGYQVIQQFLENFLHIKPGDTTSDKRFTLLPTCCLGNCDKGPTLMVNDDTYINVNIDKIINILEDYL